ncbi:MAG: hypothetical protein ABIQ12_09125 [Opitutaceae bacterium]
MNLDSTLTQLRLLGCALFAAGTLTAAPTISAVRDARKLAEAATDEAIRDELRQDIATTLARRAAPDEALALAASLPPGRRAMVLLEIAAHLPAARRTEAAQLMLDAQTAKALTHDWHKARLARLLAIGQARLDQFEAAEALARAVPDTEEKAHALHGVVAELCRAGLVAKARELAGTIEENRRYGTYRQKAAALALTARALHARGNPEDAATLLAQAELLLPKKPGWSDGIALVAVAESAHACGEPAKVNALLTHAETLAHMIAGSWKVSELARLATGWRTCGDARRARTLLDDAEQFLNTLPPLDRAEESLPLARAWAEAGEPARARAVLVAALDEARQSESAEAWRKPRVQALLAWVELFGDTPAAGKL